MPSFGIVHLVFYSLVLSAYSYAFIFDTNLFNSGKYEKVGFPFDKSYGRRAKFLTYINMTMQLFYATMGLFLAFGDLICSRYFTSCTNNVAKKNHTPKRSTLKSFFTFMHASIIFPIGAVYR